ncbi:Cyclin-dependent kinases regulatory subunit 1 [Lemmus lemmus]
MALSRLWQKRPIRSAGGVFESEAKEGERVLLGVVWRPAARGWAPSGRAVMSHKQIYYSDKYDDEEFEYRFFVAQNVLKAL